MWSHGMCLWDFDQLANGFLPGSKELMGETGLWWWLKALATLCPESDVLLDPRMLWSLPFPPNPSHKSAKDSLPPFLIDFLLDRGTCWYREDGVRLVHSPGFSSGFPPIRCLFYGCEVLFTLRFTCSFRNCLIHWPFIIYTGQPYFYSYVYIVFAFLLDGWSIGEDYIEFWYLNKVFWDTCYDVKIFRK